MTKQQALDKIKELQDYVEKMDTPTWTKIGDLEWSENLGEMNWHDAVKRCEELGGRLPTRLELIDLYDNHSKECNDLIEGEEYPWYWSSTEVNSTDAWSVALNGGNTVYTNKSTTASQIRCIQRRER